MTDNTLIIIGNGMAANRVLEELGTGHPYDEILVLGDENIPHYNRIMLSPLLADETTLEAITPHDDSWYSEHKVRILLGSGVASVDKERRVVTTSQGESYPYRDLVFATGSRSFIPDIPGKDHPAVIGFRTMSDVDTMLEHLPSLRQATGIGAGLLGVEAAVGLKLRGVEVTLLHRNPVLMNRQLDQVASGILENALAARGIEVRTGTSPSEIITEGDQISAVRVSNAEGTSDIPSQLVVFATGITPNKELAEQAGVRTHRGIQVDNQMHTSVHNVYAIGECCEFEGQTYGLVAPIWDQAKVLADRLKKSAKTTYCERTHLTKLKVSGLDVHSIGEFDATENCESLAMEDLDTGFYRKLVLRGNRIIGVLCVGDVADSHWYYELMQANTDISPFRESVLMGKAFCELGDQ